MSLHHHIQPEVKCPDLRFWPPAKRKITYKYKIALPSEKQIYISIY